jgi:hypothetical protein
MSYRFVGAARWLPFGELVGDVLYDLRYSSTFEARLRHKLEQRGSAITASLYNPAWGGFPPVAGRFIRVTGKSTDWRVVVRSALAQSGCIVLLPGVTEGLMEELRIIRSDEMMARVLLFVPKDTNESFLEAFTTRVRDVGLELSGNGASPGVLYLFRDQFVATVMVDNLEDDEAVLEMKAWLRFKSRPAPAFCEFDCLEVLPTPAGNCPVCTLTLVFERIEAIAPPFRMPTAIPPNWFNSYPVTPIEDDASGF